METDLVQGECRGHVLRILGSVLLAETVTSSLQLRLMWKLSVTMVGAIDCILSESDFCLLLIELPACSASYRQFATLAGQHCRKEHSYSSVEDVLRSSVMVSLPTIYVTN